MGYYKNLWKPKVGSMEEVMSEYSKSIGKDFLVVQIGANDGITHDPIHKFIKRDKWNGVLLEPQKFVFDKFLSKLYRKHKNIQVVNAAMGYEDGTLPIYKIGFSESRWATGLTTFDKATLEKAFSSGHVERKCAKEGVSIPSDSSMHIVEEAVRVLSVDSILGKCRENGNSRSVDLLMIDTEGFDYEVIKMFDLPRNQPGMIIFEHSHLSEQDYAECLELFNANGYDAKKDGANTVAIKKSLNKYPAYFGA